MSEPLPRDAPQLLAAARRDGRLADLPLHLLRDRAAAQRFQAAAVGALGGARCGYKIGATSAAVQRRLGCRGPFFGPVLGEHLLDDGVAFPLVPGILGLECEFGFRLGRDLPAAGEPLDITAVRNAVAECCAALEIVGRRVPATVPLDEASSIADYGLDVAVIWGRPIPGWDRLDLAATRVRAELDGTEVAAGTGALVLGHPLNALLWLASELAAGGERLRAGEIVMTGTCTGIVPVAPGQRFAGCFADGPPVVVRLA